ncbi:hypothetical protein V6N13_121646 [Hibiscus sabdariffa]
MSRKGPIPNNVTYNTLMQCMFRLRRVSTASEFLRKMLAFGQVPDIVTCSILLDGLCKTGTVYKLSENGLKPNVYTYTIMINGFLKQGLSDEAYQLFRSMRGNDCVPDSCCYNVMIQGLFRSSYNLKATQLLAEMVGKGFSADICTSILFVNLILESDKSILVKA